MSTFNCETYWNGHKPPRPGSRRGNDLNEIAVVVRTNGITLGIPVTVIGPNSPNEFYGNLPVGSKIATKENGGCDALHRPEAKILLECGFFTPMAHDITTERSACYTGCSYIWTPWLGFECLLSMQAANLLRIVSSRGINWGAIQSSQDKSPLP